VAAHTDSPHSVPSSSSLRQHDAGSQSWHAAGSGCARLVDNQGRLLPGPEDRHLLRGGGAARGPGLGGRTRALLPGPGGSAPAARWCCCPRPRRGRRRGQRAAPCQQLRRSARRLSPPEPGQEQHSSAVTARRHWSRAGRGLGQFVIGRTILTQDTTGPEASRWCWGTRSALPNAAPPGPGSSSTRSAAAAMAREQQPAARLLTTTA
jgi:hypothetical protein